MKTKNTLLLIAISIICFAFKSDDLKNKKVLDDKVEILMPVGFDIMPKDLLEAKYPSANRPTLVYSNEDGTINLALNHLPNGIKEEQLPQVVPVFVQQFTQLYPNIEWYSKGTQKINGKEFVVMEYVSPAVDTSIYNLMFITELEGRMFMCSFNCTKQEEATWKPIAHKMKDSIKINK